MEPYKSRIAEKEIQKKLRTSGAVLITGPKYVGKTTTAKMMSKTVHSFATPSRIEMYSANQKMALKGDRPILIDEWQNISSIWDEVRFQIDESGGGFGQFILTGSIHPGPDQNVIHSGEGRFSSVRMLPFSLFESGESSGEVSLSSLFQGLGDIFFKSDERTLEDVAFYICRGGWPTSLSLLGEDAVEIARNYQDAILDYKSKEKAHFFPNRQTAREILLSYARNISSEASYATIRSDVELRRNDRIDDETVSSYLERFRRLFVIEDCDAWNPNLRSKTAVRTTPTRHFVDPSIAAAALGISPDDLLNDMHSFGLFFEDLCVRDLRVYGQGLGAEVKHYRDSNGLECDAILHLRNGSWGAFEIKAGQNQIAQGIETLRKLSGVLDYEQTKRPSFLAVLTAVGDAYRTADGIYVIPITKLRD